MTISDGSTTNWLVYDGIQVVAETTAGGTVTRSYVYGPGIDNPLSMTVYTGATTVTYYYLTDHLGSVHALANTNGVIVESYKHDAWGRVLGVYDSNGAPLAESAVGNRILWMGREYSFKTGLYYFRARFYDPICGRWLSNDPIGISGGLNQYVAFLDNPVNFMDPTGLDVVYLIDTTAIAHQGHAAVAVGSDATGWTQYSFGSAGDRGEALQLGAQDNLTVRHYGTLAELRLNNSRYNESICYKTSERRNVAADREAISYFGKRYCIVGRNCDDVAADIIRAAGVNFPDRLAPKNTFRLNAANDERGPIP